MSNQFYNFLNKELLNYIRNSNVKAGDRYFLILNSDDELNKLKQSMITNEENPIQKFVSNEFNFQTFYYRLNKVNVIFIFANEGITHDFLVTIRNKISLQRDEWKDSIAIFMIKEDLDSITGGSFDLSKKGAPFHTSSLRNNLKNILKNSENNLAKYESSILDFTVSKNFEDDLVKYTLMDFESVYSIIEQGKIEDNDYYNLGIFKDKQLDTFSNNDITKRLEENKELFDTVQSIHDRGTANNQIKEKFDDPTASKLESHDWHQTDFESVKKSKEAVDTLNKIKLDFLEDDFQNQFKDIEVWDRPGGKSKSKLKERNIIIFNQNSELNNLILPFSKNIDINKNFVLTRGRKLINLTTNSNIDITFKNKNKSNLLLDLDTTNTHDSYYFEFSYRHNNKSSLTFKFRILIVNFPSNEIENIKTKYRLKFDTSSKNVEISLDNMDNLLSFKEASNEPTKVYEIGQNFDITTNSCFDFTPLISNDEPNIYFSLNIHGQLFKIKLNEFVNKPIPVNSSRLIKQIYEKKESMKSIDNIAIQGTNEYYLHTEFKKSIQIEKMMLENKYTNGSIIDSEFIGEKLHLPPEIETSYNEFCNLLLNEQTVPSLMYLNAELTEASMKYCTSVENVLSSLSDNEKIIDDTILNIHNLGLITHENKVYMTAFHPLLLKYEIEKTKYFNENKINDKIFKKYNANSLLPYYVNKDSKYYFSNYTEENARWVTYKPFESTNKMSSEKSRFIIKSRLHDFTSHFSYLFINSNFSLKARFVKITDYKVILQGVLDYLLNQLKDENNLNEINAINIYLDETENLDKLNEFYNLSSFNDLVEIFDVKIPSLVKKKFEEDDVVDIIKAKTNIYLDDNSTQYHVTFYNFNQEPKFSINNLNEINCSVTEKGLLSSISYTKLGNTYVSGFGASGIDENKPLIKTALLWNSFVANNQNHQLNPYKINSGIVNNVISIESQNLNAVFDNTNWVTFLDPSVDLSYFNNEAYDLYVIHYSDQTSSFNYESITVTNDTSQYTNILKEFLDKVNVDYTPHNIVNLIRSFNILNGEWLLNVIGNRSAKNQVQDHSVREKLSIISAYKQVLSILDNKKIKWIPISLEEIIRVSRQQGLESSSDIFTTKELNYQGSISDDLLFIGIENNQTNTKVHLMPIEVKVGNNPSNVVEKAKKQVTHLYKLLEKELIINSEKTLTQNYYRQFFLNLYFGNVKKFIENGVLIDDSLNDIYINRSHILNSDVIFSSEINENYGQGITVFFTQDNTFRKLIKDNDKNILEMHLTELDAYIDAEKDYEDVKAEIQNNKKGIDLSKVLSSYEMAIEKNETVVTLEDNIKLSKDIDINEDVNEITQNILPTKNTLKDTRILLGNIKGSTQPLYWEYGHYQLPNRHLLISGKSGQGKTYFMQCLLYEMSNNKLDSLIVDYTDGFLENHLEPEFISKLNNNIETKFVFTDKLPINPFKKKEIDLGGIYYPEENDDTADRIVQIIDFVFKLGIQQSSLLKQSIKSGLDRYGDDFTFTKLKQYLLDEDTSASLNLVGRISKLLDKDPFVYKNNDFTWDKVFNNHGKVNIMQLKGFVADIQKIITEFLLWDLYNYSERKGEKNSPIPVLLDEMQNLNHKESSPTTKILKEGRKFGWSSWLATQSISTIKNNNGDISALFNAAQQIHFAPPEDQIPFISKNITTNIEERKRLESNLSSLNKGECIVNGYSNINGELKKVVEVIEVTPLEFRG